MIFTTVVALGLLLWASVVTYLNSKLREENQRMKLQLVEDFDAMKRERDNSRMEVQNLMQTFVLSQPALVDALMKEVLHERGIDLPRRRNGHRLEGRS